MAIAAVRPAADSDVDEIVRIQADTWRVAYAGIVPPEALEQLRGDQARAAWADAVAAGAGSGAESYWVFVAGEGEWTVGFCAAARYAGREDRDIAEISALVVEPRWARRGHGGRLLAAAAEALRAAGSERGRAWVPETDAATRGFYARAGWAPDGAVRTLDTGVRTVREVRCSGPLDLVLTGS
ncbi:GNAT family N-acetyltransferase [Pseudonocardia sp. T1-2H]|uniref:GNAT family N-acetyltransferase n=1 Tax=Pseudonocardia sp. T1-2H TaxID=3128899 RepID=UPI003100BA04